MPPATADHRAHGRRWMVGAGLGLSGAAAGWHVRHRRSPIVRCWRPGAGEHRIGGGLSVRSAGEVVVAGDARLVIPDLLGFGRSLNDHHADLSLVAHLATLDLMAQELDLAGRALTLAGHSFGALLALHWAARRHDVERVVCFCTPLYRDARARRGPAPEP